MRFCSIIFQKLINVQVNHVIEKQWRLALNLDHYLILKYENFFSNMFNIVRLN